MSSAERARREVEAFTLALDEFARTTPVSRADFEARGLQWPLTVHRGNVVRDGDSIYFRSPDGATWALNGPARTNHQDIASIHAEDAQVRDAVIAAGAIPNQTTMLRISLAPLIRMGRDLPRR